MQRSSQAGIGVSTSMERREAITITPELIQETIKNWDVRACGQRMYVAVIQEEKTSGGIIMIETHQDIQHDAVIISCGPMAIINDQSWTAVDGTPIPENEARWLSTDDLECATRRFLKPGDHITISKWSGEEVHRKCSVKGGLRKLMIINDLDCIGVPER